MTAHNLLLPVFTSAYGNFQLRRSWITGKLATNERNGVTETVAKFFRMRSRHGIVMRAVNIIAKIKFHANG
jgi:hypothetical protein